VGAETPAEVPDVAEAPDVADEFRFYDVVGDALTPNAELLTGDTTEPAAKDVVDVVDELDAARREGREINWDSLISGLLAAGQGTSTATALRGFGMGSQAERRRQEALAIEQEQAQLERDLRREILGEESTIAREQMETQLAITDKNVAADIQAIRQRADAATVERFDDYVATLNLNNPKFAAAYAEEVRRLEKTYGAGWFTYGILTNQEKEDARRIAANKVKTKFIDDWLSVNAPELANRAPSAEEILAQARREVAE
jgi:hypothetical protein